ncbi:MAG: EpsG family protein [Paracoccaceae bacterium]
MYDGDRLQSGDADIPLRILFAIVLAIVFALVILFRSPTFDNDYLNYEAVYQGYLESDFEVGFQFLMDVGAVADLPLTALLSVIALPGLLIKFLLAGRVDGVALSVFTILFASSFFLLHELNQSRFAFAVSFALLAAWMRQKRPILAMSMLLFGALFHYSVLLLLPAILGTLATIVFFTCLGIFQFMVQSTGATADFLLSLMPSFLSESDRVRGYTVETVALRNSGLVVTLSIVFLAFQLIVARMFERIYLGPEDYDSLLIVSRRAAIVAIPVFITFISSPVMANRLAEAHRFFLLFYLSIVIAKAIKGKGIDPILAIIFLVIVIVGNLYIYGGSVLPLYEIIKQIGLGRNVNLI